MSTGPSSRSMSVIDQPIPAACPGRTVPAGRWCRSYAGAHPARPADSGCRGGTRSPRRAPRRDQPQQLPPRDRTRGPTGRRPVCPPTWLASWPGGSASPSSCAATTRRAMLADDAAADAWDVGNIGAEPARAETIAFTDAYCEIECTYLVAAGSPITSVAEVDRAGCGSRRRHAPPMTSGSSATSTTPSSSARRRWTARSSSSSSRGSTPSPGCARRW